MLFFVSPVSPSTEERLHDGGDSALGLLLWFLGCVCGSCRCGNCLDKNASASCGVSLLITMGRNRKWLVNMHLRLCTRLPCKVVSEFITFSRQIDKPEDEEGACKETLES